MEVVWLKFLKNWYWYEAGDIVSLKSSPLVHRLIREGVAERYLMQNMETVNVPMG